MNQYKNLCAKIPIELHDHISSEKENSGLGLNDYIEQIISEYYLMKKEGGRNMNQENTRTLAIQIPVELMERIKVHLKGLGISQKAFLIGIIEKSLAEFESEITTDGGEDEQI